PRIAFAALPDLRVDVAEQAEAVRQPRPPVVVGDARQRCQRDRQPLGQVGDSTFDIAPSVIRLLPVQIHGHSTTSVLTEPTERRKTVMGGAVLTPPAGIGQRAGVSTTA